MNFKELVVKMKLLLFISLSTLYYDVKARECFCCESKESQHCEPQQTSIVDCGNKACFLFGSTPTKGGYPTDSLPPSKTYPYANESYFIRGCLEQNEYCAYYHDKIGGISDFVCDLCFEELCNDRPFEDNAITPASSGSSGSSSPSSGSGTQSGGSPSNIFNKVPSVDNVVGTIVSAFPKNLDSAEA